MNTNEKPNITPEDEYLSLKLAQARHLLQNSPLDAMPEIIEIVAKPIVLDFITILLKKPITNDAGAVFQPGNYFINPKDGTLYTLKDNELSGFEWNDGRQVTVGDIVQIAANDEALAAFIDWARYNAFYDTLVGQLSFEDMAQAVTEEEPPLKLTITRPADYTIPIDKLNKSIITLQQNVETPLITLKGRTVGITARVYRRNSPSMEDITLSNDGEICNTTGTIIKPYMLPILNACYSIWNRAKAEHIAPAFTDKTLYRQIYGIEETTYIKDAALNEINDILAEMADIYMIVDAQKEVSARIKDKDVANDILRDGWNGLLLPLDKRKIEVGGYVGEGYIMLRQPLNFRAAEVTRQVITLPPAVINTSKRLNNSLFTASIRDYLIREITYMEEDKRRSNKISYLSIYEYCGVTPENYKNVKDKRAKTRAQIKKLLDHFKDNGRITQYEEYFSKNGRQLAGVSLTLPGT